MGIRATVDHRHRDHVALVVDVDHRAARERSVGHADRAASEDLSARGPVPPEARPVERRLRTPVESQRQRRCGAGGGRGLGALDHGADRELPGPGRVPSRREGSVRLGVGVRHGDPDRVAAHLIDLDDVAGVGGWDGSRHRHATFHERRGLRGDRDPAAARAHRDVPGGDGDGRVLTRARAPGAGSRAARARSARGEGEPWDHHGAGGGGHERGQIAMGASVREQLVSPLVVCLRGELTGSRLVSATVPRRTDSPLRIRGSASGSPADRPRTDDRSA